MAKLTASRVLRNTIKLFERGRWYQGGFEHNDQKGRSCYCIAGAIIRAPVGKHPGTDACNTSVPARQTALDLVVKAIRGKDTDDIYTYNDEKRRTIGQIIGVLQRALARAEKIEAKAA